jgi:hypothetical protein
MSEYYILSTLPLFLVCSNEFDFVRVTDGEVLLK